MFGLGMGEILLIAVVALLVLGPEKLPQAAKSIGKGIRDLRKQTRELQDTIENDTQLGDAVRELKGALRDDPLRPNRPPPNRDGIPGQRAAPRIAPASGAEPRPPAGGGGEGTAAEATAAAAEGGAASEGEVSGRSEGEAAPGSKPAPRDGSAHG